MPLRAVSDVVKGQQLNVIDLVETGKYPCLNGGMQPSGFTNDYNRVENTITISEGGNSCGYVNFIDKKFWCGGHCYSVSIKNKYLDKKYFYQYLKAQESKIMALRVGSGLPNIQKKSILEYEVCFPSSLVEQQRIAECLGGVDDLINAVIDKIEAFKGFKKGLMQQLFPAEDKTTPVLRFPEFQNNREWEKITLGKIAKIITGNTPSTRDSDNYAGKKLFVSPADISGERYISQTKTTLSEKGFSRARCVKENSILFVCIGSTIGKIAQNKIECATNQQINSLVPHEDYVADFVYSILEYYVPKIVLNAGRHAIPIINKTLFASISILVPQKEEQQKIAEYFLLIDELISAESRRLDQLKIHKKYLMQNLFPSINFHKL